MIVQTPSWPTLVLVTVAGLVVAALGVGAATSTTAFAPYNPTWEGTSDFRTLLEDDPVDQELLTDTERYDELEANGTVAFVVGPDEPYGEMDTERLSRFVNRGGTLVVLENFGPGDTLLESLDTEAALDGQVVFDERNYHRGPAMPLATNVSDDPEVDDVDQVTLNVATVIDPGDASVWVRTSEFAYLGDETTTLEEADALDSYPVVTAEPMGEGRVIVVSDPSIAINSMLTEPDNEALLAGFIAGHERAVIDASASGELPPAIAAMLTARALPALQAAFAGIVVAVIAGGSSARLRQMVMAGLRWRPGGDDRREGTPEESVLTHDERLDVVRHRHPEWNEARIERVTMAWAERSTESARSSTRPTSDESGPRDTRA